MIAQCSVGVGTKPISVRRLTAADERAVDAFLTKVRRQVVQVPSCKAASCQYCYLLEQGGQPGGICGVSLTHPTAARLCIFALRDDWSVTRTLGWLLPPIVHALRARGVELLFYTGAEEWLLRGLYASGFHLEETLLLLQKTDFAVPGGGNRAVDVRPAEDADLPGLLAVDGAAFVPMWQIAGEAFLRYLDRCPFFVVAELDGAVVGFAYAYLVGRHGHLSRIAVHPRYGGRGIGTRLLAEAIRFFQREQVFGITLNTQADNHRARRLYERFGFQVVGREAWVVIKVLA